jgi:hypothetical protein
MKIIELAGTANSNGTLTVDAVDSEPGYVEKVVMDYNNGDAIADLVLTCQGEVAQNILTKANLGVVDFTWYPRLLGHNGTDGSDFAFSMGIPIMVTGKLRAAITGSTINISAIDGDATTITVDTAAAHNLVAGNTVTIAGTTNYNGTYTVATKTDADTFTITDATHNVAAENAGTMIHGGCTYRFLVYLSDPK